MADKRKTRKPENEAAKKALHDDESWAKPMMAASCAGC